MAFSFHHEIKWIGQNKKKKILVTWTCLESRIFSKYMRIATCCGLAYLQNKQKEREKNQFFFVNKIVWKKEMKLNE